MSFSTPILLILFNRPDLTKKLIENISLVKPSVIFVACDGPRLGRVDDLERISQVKEIVEGIKWPCEIHKKYSDVNLGSRDGPASAIKWVLEQSESAIILEDDCLPSVDFFDFCTQMLQKYKDEKNVGLVAGNCFVEPVIGRDDSYFFSKYAITWGWATWADRWLQTYDIEMSAWPSYRDSGRMFVDFANARERSYWTSIFERVYSGDFATAWDYQWFFANLTSNRLTIYPSRNLITNAGSGDDATHTKSKSLVLDVPSSRLRFPLRHPKTITMDPVVDAKLFGIYFQMSFLNRIRNKLRKFIYG
jgi:hypothetical protein